MSRGAPRRRVPVVLFAMHLNSAVNRAPRSHPRQRAFAWVGVRPAGQSSKADAVMASQQQLCTIA